ncbi:PREDICTED: peroxisomal membrane protein PEX14 [Polistes dominula]|uniref:Peroxisomal membrane protein PEX14 n=1 Tax=Polistes dominula TaxID=743375 RepID=A0ABM1IKL3_POLDO|nr:PREDICTED: peroxisomal membrane protein PEX14 [Polistes dominula]XP_015180750.1 PREDICTED: peroxisomal membrane protein PEX14 [Polistes dominula]
MTGQDITDLNKSCLRENLIKAAVQFFQHPEVSRAPLSRKQEFLKRKGLSEEEIKKACEIAGVDTNEQKRFDNQNEYTAISIPEKSRYPYLHVQSYQLTLLQKIKEFFNVTAVIGATLYCVYWFYKEFIQPFLFGRKKKNSITDTVTELDIAIQNSIKEMKDSISKVEVDVKRLSQNQSIDIAIPQLVQELKQELSSLKALLLSRKQFPSAPASIPSWQLSTSTVQEKATEREDDAGSGSSTNNSDSSLEIVRDEPPKD